MDKICMQFMSLNMQGTSKSRPKDNKLKKQIKKERHIIEASSNKRTNSFPLFDRIIHLYKIK